MKHLLKLHQHHILFGHNGYKCKWEGRWYDLYDDTPNHFRIKCATPTELITLINKLIENQNRQSDFLLLQLEFTINCQNLINQVWDEQTQFIPITDEKNNSLIDKINDITKKDVKPTAKCEIPKENTENNVKIPVVNQTSIDMKTPKINTYDPLNKFKKTVKEIK